MRPFVLPMICLTLFRSASDCQSFWLRAPIARRGEDVGSGVRHVYKNISISVEEGNEFLKSIFNVSIFKNK